MKRILIFIIVFGCLSVISAQESNNGKIAFLFDGEKVNLPVQVARLQKGDDILISVSANGSNEKTRTSLNIQFSFKNLKSQKINAKDIAIDLSRNSSIHFFLRNNRGVYSGFGTRFEFTDVKLKFEIIEVTYENGAMKISGKFDGGFTGTAIDEKIEIKNGKFEINF